jgi:hypothetical protein
MLEPVPTVPEHDLFEELRRRRAELRESMDALERALAAPPSKDPARWVERVHVALVELSADFRQHIAITEGPDGLYRDLRDHAARLSEPVARLTREHKKVKEIVGSLEAQLDSPQADLDSVRELATGLLGILVRHRQRGSDLVYQAYDVDVGGET